MHLRPGLMLMGCGILASVNKLKSSRKTKAQSGAEQRRGDMRRHFDCISFVASKNGRKKWRFWLRLAFVCFANCTQVRLGDNQCKFCSGGESQSQLLLYDILSVGNRRAAAPASASAAALPLASASASVSSPECVLCVCVIPWANNGNNYSGKCIPTQGIVDSSFTLGKKEGTGKSC